MTPACSRRSNSAKSICSLSSTVTWHQLKYFKNSTSMVTLLGLVSPSPFWPCPPPKTQAARAGVQCGLGCRRQALTCQAESHPQWPALGGESEATHRDNQWSPGTCKSHCRTKYTQNIPLSWWVPTYAQHFINKIHVWSFLAVYKMDLANKPHVSTIKCLRFFMECQSIQKWKYPNDKKRALFF